MMPGLDSYQRADFRTLDHVSAAQICAIGPAAAQPNATGRLTVELVGLGTQRPSTASARVTGNPEIGTATTDTMISTNGDGLISDSDIRVWGAGKVPPPPMFFTSVDSKGS